MFRKASKGYIETSSLFGWIVFIALAGTAIYYGKLMYDAYSDGYDHGHKDGVTFQMSPDGRQHGKMFRDLESTFIDSHRGKYHERNFRDKAFIYGWDAGFHDIVDKMLNS